MSESVISRRQALVGCAAACAAVPLLAACGSDDTSTGTPSSTPTTTGPSGSASSSASGRPTTPALSSTSDIPVGGGKIFGDENVVVTQPTDGDFKAFEATCTHQGGALTSISDGDIVCSLHGSRFSIKDGSVDNPPARAPLPTVGITVADGEIFLS